MMKRLVLLSVLLCFVSGDVFALGALRRQVGRIAAHVKNVSSPSPAGASLVVVLLGAAVLNITSFGIDKHTIQSDAPIPLVREAHADAKATSITEMKWPMWGIEMGHYHGTGVWQDNQGNEGELEISFVTTIKGYDTAEEDIWLTVSYGEKELKMHKTIVYGDTDLKFWTLAGWPANVEAYISPGDYDEPPAKTTYKFNGGLVKLVRLTKDGKTTSLSGEILLEDDRAVQWDNVELTTLTFIRGD